MNQRQNYLAEGYRDVDSQGDVEKFKTALAFMDTLPSFRTYKDETERLLRPADGKAFADIGCGLGFDVERVARRISGTVFGLDTSFEFLKEARDRARSLGLSNAEYVVEDAHKMSFIDGQFDGVRVDRTLQHVADPALVITEMARVARKGGRVVCAEPDWGSFFIDDDDFRCVAAVSDIWTGSIRNRNIGRQLPRFMTAAGLTQIQTSGFLLATYGLKDVNLVFDVKKTAEFLAQSNPASGVASWYERLELRDSRSPVFAGVTIIVAAGVRE